MSASYKWICLENTPEELYAHTKESCKGLFFDSPCSLHNRTFHHMRSWPQHWRGDRKLMERICKHGVGHPDPDNIKYANVSDSVHGCDGCCQPPTTTIEAPAKLANSPLSWSEMEKTISRLQEALTRTQFEREEWKETAQKECDRVEQLRAKLRRIHSKLLEFEKETL